MADQQPPRKKSRFFADGNATLESSPNPQDADSKSEYYSNSSRSDLPAQTRASTLTPNLQRLDLSVTRASAPIFNSTIKDAVSITPTATAFRELSVEDKVSRRKGVYGAQELFTPAENRHGISGVFKQDREVSNPTLNMRASLPWEKDDRNHPGLPLLATSVNAAEQTPFTFRAPVQHHDPVQYPAIAPDSRITTVFNRKPHEYTGVTENSSFMQVQKQRTELWPEPPTPSVPNFPPIPGVNRSANRPTPVSYRIREASSHAIDVDRDARGILLSSNPAVHLTTLRPAMVAENALSSPGRLRRASDYVNNTRKRKRSDGIPPPPAFVFTRKNDPTFTAFSGILLYPELCFHLASHLPVDDLVSLYAISRDFHTIIDTRFTTTILSQALKKAPTSSRIFPFRSYGHFCRNDPAARLPHPDPLKAAVGVVRKIPSFRWLKMILYREKAVHAMMTMFAERGIPLPRRCELALKKIWFIMDIPDNARRIGFVHNKQLLSDVDLYFGTCFFVKLDMLFTDPVASRKHVEGRNLLMSQPSLTMLLKVLKGEALCTRWDIMKEYIRWKYDAGNEIDAADPNGSEEMLFGIPRSEWGLKRKEYWGKKRDKDGGLVPTNQLGTLLRPDQLIIREAVKRGLRFAGHYVRFLLYGYVHPITLEDFEPRKMTRWIGDYNEDDYTIDDAVAGCQALSIAEGGDPYLDLGPDNGASARSTQREGPSRMEREIRANQDAFIAQMYADSEQERRNMGLL